jgi:hypothetical protein
MPCSSPLDETLRSFQAGHSIVHVEALVRPEHLDAREGEKGLLGEAFLVLLAMLVRCMVFETLARLRALESREADLAFDCLGCCVLYSKSAIEVIT